VKTALLAIAVFVGVYAAVAVQAWFLNRRTKRNLARAAELDRLRGPDPHQPTRSIGLSRPELKSYLALWVVSLALLFTGVGLEGRKGAKHPIGLALMIFGWVLNLGGIYYFRRRRWRRQLAETQRPED